VIIYGWGKDLKQVAYAGIERCQNCSNFGHFWLCEQSSYASLYFVKVAKWNKRLFLMCQTCQRGWELEQKDKASIIRSTLGLPTPQDCQELWDEIGRRISLTAARIDQLGHLEPVSAVWETTFNNIVFELGRRHDREHVKYVLSRFVASLGGDGAQAPTQQGRIAQCE